MKTLAERFNEKWTPEPNTGCWLWHGAVNGGKYGVLYKNGRGRIAHRISWELHYGPIPRTPGHHHGSMCVLHKCDTTLCVNPDHLFLGTQQDNIADMHQKGRRTDYSFWSSKTHCPYGHEYTPENTYMQRGSRVCRICRRRRVRTAQKKRRQ